MSIAHFSLSYLIYCLFIALVAYAVPFLFPDEVLLTRHFWLIYGIVSGATLIAYLVADFGLKKSPESGIMMIMGAIVVKMFFLMAFVLIFSLKTQERGLVFVLNFFSLYLLFSFFEIYALLRNLRHQNK